MKKKTYDLIVLGTGSAGSTVATKCRKAGWKVAIIDSRPFGGTCALRGCDPKKVLVGAAEIVERSRAIEGKGIEKETKIDWNELMKFKNSFTKPVPKSMEESFKKAGIDTYHGDAVFTEKDIINVNGKELKGKYFIIATGAKPRRLDIPGEEHLTFSDEFLELKKLPKKIIFAGGGYVSFELAHIAAMAGAKVKILHRSDKVLKQFEQDLVEMLLEKYKDSGIEIIFNTPVKEIKKRKGNELQVKSDKKSFTADMVVHGAGRVPDVDTLNLEVTKVKYGKKGVITNSYMQSSNKNIYAGGDAAEKGLPLTPVAGEQGRIIANNLLKRKKESFDSKATSTSLFSYPVMASVGMTEEQAKKQKVKYEKKFGDTSSWYTSKRIGLSHSGFKVLKDKQGKILGAHLLYPAAEEMINIFMFAIKNKLKTEELKQYLYAYPSSSNDIKSMI